MPEGHTIARLARDQRRLLVGRRPRADSPQGRFVEGAAALDGRLVTGVEPYGKHLWHAFEGDVLLHVHLGLYGAWTSGPPPPPEPRGAVRLRLVTDDAWLELRGPTACELHTPADRDAVLARLGPDPLHPRADGERAWQRITRSRSPIGQLLMDQSVLAGVGNVYRAEVLYRARVHPLLLGRDLPRASWDAIWADLRALMRAGVRANRIVTTEPADRSRRRGAVARADAWYVYRRAGEPCRACGAEVRVAELAARRLYWCEICQTEQ